VSDLSQVRTVPAGTTSFLLREHAQGTPGEGTTPVLLLHGVPETSSCWREVVPALAAGRRVLAPDLPGLGGSAYSGPYDVTSLATQVAALLDAEGGERVDVVGHDWGGVVALGLAGLRPDLVRRLVIANAPYRTGPPAYRAVHIPLLALPVLPELALRLAGRRLVDSMINLGWRSTPPLDEERRAEYAAAYTGRDHLQAFLGYYRAAARPQPGALVPGSALAKALGPVDVERALVLWGALDPVLPIWVGEAATRDLGPRTRMTTIPGVGHFVLEEAPDVVGDVLLEFLS
jgi:pimeloyl-ACP methyl ester carboxylesterase